MTVILFLHNHAMVVLFQSSLRRAIFFFVQKRTLDVRFVNRLNSDDKNIISYKSRQTLFWVQINYSMYEYNNCACRATITTSIIIARPSSTASTRNCAPGGTQNNYCEYTYCASTKQLLRVHLLRVHKTTAGTQLRVQRYKSNYYCE